MTTPEIVSAPASQPSVLDDIIEIFYAPSRVFARQRDNPRFWGAFIILSILFALGVWVMMRNLASVMDAQMSRQMAEALRKNPQLTQDQLERGRRIGEMMAPISGLFIAVITTLILGVVIWVIGKFFDSKADVNQGLMIATFASFPKVIDLILAAVLALVLGTDNIPNMLVATPSLARFAPTGIAPQLLGLLSRLSIGIVWATILIAIGLHVVGRIPKARAYAAAVIIWLLGSALVIATAARSV
ncbi:MAG: YIP1 family protein [Gemmatimonadaceae bacterium]|nr:YIP1 family protein [Gemmatimonadaceae bacterium]